MAMAEEFVFGFGFYMGVWGWKAPNSNKIVNYLAALTVFMALKCALYVTKWFGGMLWERIDRVYNVNDRLIRLGWLETPKSRRRRCQCHAPVSERLLRNLIVVSLVVAHVTQSLKLQV